MSGSRGRETRSVRQDQKAETQARIVRAAMELFATRGFDATPVSAIAEEAGVSRGAVFWHFGDKATLFQEALRRLLTPFVEELSKSIMDLEPRDRIFELFGVYEQFVDKNRQTIEVFIRWVLESPTLRPSLQKELFALHDSFVRDIRETLDELMGDRPEAPALAAALISLLDGNLLLSLLDPNPEARSQRREGLRVIAKLVLAEGEKLAESSS